MVLPELVVKDTHTQGRLVAEWQSYEVYLCLSDSDIAFDIPEAPAGGSKLRSPLIGQRGGRDPDDPRVATAVRMDWWLTVKNKSLARIRY
jgi:hypothetical protein